MRISGITYVPRRTHRVRNTVYFFSLLILVFAIALAFISLYTAWKLIHPEKTNIPAFSSNIVPEYQNAAFIGKDKDITLKGWFFKSKDSDKTIILVHGYRQNRLQFKEQTLDLIKSLLSKGYSVLAFDLRNSGESGGNMSSLGYYEKDDVNAAVKYVKSQGSKNIVLMGFSTGAAASLLAASENTDVSAVIADSPYADLRQYLDNGLPSWTSLPAVPFNRTVLFCIKNLAHIDYGQASPLNFIHRLAPRPVLLIHSKGDTSIPVSHSEELYEAYLKSAANSVEFWRTEGTGHLGSYEKYPKEYMDRVSKFLDKLNIKK